MLRIQSFFSEHGKYLKSLIGRPTSGRLKEAYLGIPSDGK